MADSIAGTYANLAGTEIVNDARTLAYLKSDSGLGSIQVYGDCGCDNLFDVIGCLPPLVDLDQYVDLPGTAGNYISTPDTAANSLQGTLSGVQLSGKSVGIINTPDNPTVSITGDIDIRFWLKPDVWNMPGNGLNLAGKFAGAGQRSWRLQIQSTGRPTLELSADGTAAPVATASTAITIPNGIAGWLRVTWRQSDGRVQFFTAPDGPTPIWTQLGTDQTIAIASIFDSTTSVDILANANNNVFKTIIYKFELLNGINNIVVANPDFTKNPWVIGDVAGAARLDTAGRTWTLGNDAEIVANAERRSLRLSGAINTFASTPDAAALDITGDIDMRVKLAMDDWTPAAVQQFINKETPTTQRSYGFRVNTAGNLVIRYSIDGTNAVEFGSTVATGFTDGSINWVRVTKVSATGVIQFFTSVDGVTWVQLGTNVAGTAGAMFVSTAPLEIGVRSGSNDPFTGNIFAVEVRNGINGTIVADPVFSARPWDVNETSGATGADAAGNTWTLNGAGAVIQRAFESDIDVRIKLAANDWTPGVDQTYIGKLSTTGNQRSWRLAVDASNNLIFFISPTGVISYGLISQAISGLGFIDGQTNWLRITVDMNNGSGGHTTVLYTSIDGVNWIVRQTQINGGYTGISMIFDSTALVEIGAHTAGSASNFDGNIYYAEFRNGIDGVIVTSFDANDTPATSATTPNTVTSSRSGEVWTINGAGWVWGNGAYTYPNYPYTAYPGYVSPAVDDAPWYTPDTPASGEFLGFIVSEFEGLDSPFSRSVSQNIGNGGILSRARLGTREMTWTGYLFGSSCCGTQYGLKWLSQALARFNPSCRDCLGDDLELLICCPDDAISATGQSSPFRTLKGVGLLEGPNVLSQRKTCTNDCTNGCGGSCILEIEFTLVASQPYMYSPPIPLYDCIDFDSNSSTTVVDPDAPCPPFDCGQATLDILKAIDVLPCPEVVLPPTADYVNSCFTDLVTDLGPTVYYTVPRTEWPQFEEVVPVITISNTNGFYNPGVKIGFFRSFDGNPCGDLTLNAPDCDALCDDLLIGPLPPNSSFYIDGRTRKMSIICADGSAFSGEKLTNGPWSWPSFTDLGFCLAIQFVDGFPGMCASLSIVPRTF